MTTKPLTIIGVTGTNGKTSCTHFIADVLTQLGKRVGLIGTLGSGIYGMPLVDTGLTTPGAPALQAQLAAFAEQGVEIVAMEVSSHGIAQDRIKGVSFAAGVFTNLTQDHLDYHGTMEAYAAVKYKFLASPMVEIAVVNEEDPYGQTWLPSLKAMKPVVTYSKKDARALTVPLIGSFNLSNAAAVFTTLCALKEKLHLIPAEVAAALAQIKPVPGRMQTVGGGELPLVVIDYSHTPDSLEKALCALKPETRGKLWCVFGCGGDRDASKRPLMAQQVERFADRVILTNDNPRTESPEAIAHDAMSGFVDKEKVEVILDRSQAIRHSIESADAADVILLAGKGAEKYQQIGTEKRPFDDVVEATRWLAVKNK